MRAMLALSASIFLMPLSSHGDDKGAELRGSFPVQVYMGTCVLGRADSKNVDLLAQEKGFKEAPKEVSKKYLGNNKGRAWHLKNSDGEFGISIIESGLCSVYIHQGEPEALKASMEAWLPPPNVGFSYKAEQTEKNGLTTISYELYRGDSFLERWTITLTKGSTLGLVGIMSYDAP